MVDRLEVGDMSALLALLSSHSSPKRVVYVDEKELMRAGVETGAGGIAASSVLGLPANRGGVEYST